jgi:predicted aspartyl protease
MGLSPSKLPQFQALKRWAIFVQRCSVAENMDAKRVPQTTAFELTEACYSLRRVIRPRLWWSPSRVLAILLASVAVVSELPGANQSAQASAQYEALPLIRSRQNHLLVRAVINGRQAWLGVDSGAPVSAIALHRREHFRLTGIPSSSKLPARLQINGGFNNVAIVHNFALGNLNLVDEPVVTVNLRSSTRAARLLEEQEIDGILGADILFPTKAVLDCKRQLLVLKMYPELPGHAPGFDYRGFSAVPIQVSDGFNLYVNAAINGAPAKLMVDTGAFATLLHRPFVRHLRIPMRETPYSSAAVNLRQRGVNIARIRKLSVGSVDIVGKEVGVIDLEGLIRRGLLQGSPPVAGLLGGEILNRHHGIIDFGTRTLYLRR